MAFAGSMPDMSGYLSPKANLGLVGANSLLQRGVTDANAIRNDAAEEEAQIRANYLRESSAAQADFLSQSGDLQARTDLITTGLGALGSVAGSAGKAFGPGFGLFGNKGGGLNSQDASGFRSGLGYDQYSPFTTSIRNTNTF